MDDAFIAEKWVFARTGFPKDMIRPSIQGECVRDWVFDSNEEAACAYDSSLSPLDLDLNAKWGRYFWTLRSSIASVISFGGKTRKELGEKWWTWYRWITERYAVPNSIVYADIATHNHFVFDRGGKVFNRTAPVIKLDAKASEDDHLALLGLLNSSTACFWLKQVSHQKQMMGGDGIRIESKAKVPYAFSGTQLGKMPLPETWATGKLRERIIKSTRMLEKCAEELSQQNPSLAILNIKQSATQMRASWSDMRERQKSLRSSMIQLQEEIDFTVYVMWGLADERVLSDGQWLSTPLTVGDRPIDILRGRNEDDFTVPSGIPPEWPMGLQKLWQNRIDAIKESSELKMIEEPHYKRRWIGRQGLFNHTKNKDDLDLACEQWFLLRLESYFDFDDRMTVVGDTSTEPAMNAMPLGDIAMYTVARLADAARRDPQFMEVGELYRNDAAFDVQSLVEELVAAESVPHLPILRYKDSGLRKRAEWEKTWDLQRREDAMSGQLSVISAQLKAEKVEKKNPALQAEFDRLTTENRQLTTSIPVPPKYISADFISTGGARYWSLRGKLDVPKERWISFPHCEGPDGALVICWAGYDHLQQAQAISAYYVRVQTEFGGSDDPRLIPLLASLIELLPWLAQWHNEPNANFDGLRMGDYFEGFTIEEARNLGKTLAEIKAWVPPKKVAKKKAAKRAPKKAMSQGDEK
jgi:hypothetical protein